MRISLFCFVILVAVALPSCSVLQKPSGTNPLLREIKNKHLIPEGIAINPMTGEVYLSSLHLNKIVRANKDGSVTDLISKQQDGFMWGLGMKFSADGNTLWACSADGKGNSGLFLVDLSSGMIIKQYKHDSARFLNDLTIMQDGRIFITDTEKGAVLLWQHDSLRLFLQHEKLKWANGITVTPDGKYLFVASGRWGLQRIDIKSGVIVSATNDKRIDYAIDGLVIHNKILYAAIGWPQDSIHQHRILRYYLDMDFNYQKADTLAINKSWLQCPTTLAIHKDRLYALGNTNLGIYNRHAQKIDKISDSLLLPVVSGFLLKR